MAVYYFNPRKALIQSKHWESFCYYNCKKLIKDGRLQCDCGENADMYMWQWEKQTENNVVLSLEDREVLFHPVYSTGTAAVKGTQALKLNHHHYWEIKILTNLYGTDIMIGVGTSKVSLSERQYKFCSLLGYDNQSWGYSYHGIIQHDKLLRKYGPLFGLGSIIGVHLDLCSGTLRYYLNRKPLGIAFNGLKGNELFPMVSSTAAQSAVRMICSLSLQPTLQLKCLMVIRKYPDLVKSYHSIPGLSRLMRQEYFWIMPPPVTVPEPEQKIMLSLEDEVVLPFHMILHAAKRRKCMRKARRYPLYNREFEAMQNIMRIASENRKENVNHQESASSSHDENKNPVSLTTSQINKTNFAAPTDFNKDDAVSLDIDDYQSSSNCDRHLNAIDDGDVIVKCDKYLSCMNYQDDVNINKPSSSSEVYENLDDYVTSEKDISNLENRYCEMCSLTSDGEGLSQGVVCLCDTII